MFYFIVINILVSYILVICCDSLLSCFSYTTCENPKITLSSQPSCQSSGSQTVALGQAGVSLGSLQGLQQHKQLLCKVIIII